MPYQDLREFIARLAEEGEVQNVEREVDWNLEVGAIIRRSYDLKAPAPFFQKIKGYPSGFRIFGAPCGVSKKPGRFFARLAMSLDLRPDTPVQDIVESYIQRKRNPIKPTMVSGGPCKENVYRGNEVDLLKLPVPLIHDGDGGRYIGTWHSVITRDPDTGWVNWGMYRMMVHDRNTVGLPISPLRDIGAHYYQKYESRDKPMEFAVVLGAEPVTPLISASRMPFGMDEADIIGGIRGAPLEMVKCETVDLAVPATAEIVLEGEIRPHERRDEGPFGEYTGHMTPRTPKPVGHIRAITHRHDPILPVSCMGVPIDDCAAFIPIRRDAEILDDLRTRGFPVKTVYSPPQGIGHMMVISTKVPYAAYAQHLAHAVWGNPGWGKFINYLIVVDDDVDATNMDEVIWVMSTRLHPYRGITRVENFPGAFWLPFISPQEREHDQAAAVLFDCTWPKDWPPEAIPTKVSFDVAWPAAVQQQVLRHWRDYGYEE